MTDRATAAREKAAKLSKMRHAPVVDPVTVDDAPATVAAPERPAVARVRPVKVSLELAPELHADLLRWCMAAASELQRGRVNSTEPLRELVRRLLSDEQLSAEVIAALRREGKR